MAVTITTDITHHFMSAYSPIRFVANDAAADVAFMRGEILIESPLASGNFISTGVLIKAQRDDVSSSNFSFNLMGYVRQYLDNDQDVAIYDVNPNNLSPNFKFNAWSVRYSQSAPYNLYDDTSDIIESTQFRVLSTIVYEGESNTIDDSHKTLDRFVIGTNRQIAQPINTDVRSFLTNIPDGGTVYRGGLKTSFFQPIAKLTTQTAVVMYYNITTGEYYVINVGVNNVVTNIAQIHTNPDAIEFTFNTAPPSAATFSSTGSGNVFVDASGNLLADEINVQCYIIDLAYLPMPVPTQYMGVSSKTFKVSEDDNLGKCRNTRFKFKNMRGGFDVFNAHGTETKSVSVSGKTYDNFVAYNDDSKHGTTNLMNTRTDEWSVFSQPLTTENVTWLEELITSPLVWIEVEKPNAQDPNLQGRVWVPIIINKGSYKVRTTENSVHYLEFKYRRSNKISTQKN